MARGHETEVTNNSERRIGFLRRAGIGLAALTALGTLPGCADAVPEPEPTTISTVDTNASSAPSATEAGTSTAEPAAESTPETIGKDTLSPEEYESASELAKSFVNNKIDWFIKAGAEVTKLDGGGIHGGSQETDVFPNGQERVWYDNVTVTSDNLSDGTTELRVDVDTRQICLDSDGEFASEGCNGTVTREKSHVLTFVLSNGVDDFGSLSDVSSALEGARLVGVDERTREVASGGSERETLVSIDIEPDGNITSYEDGSTVRFGEPVELLERALRS